MANQFDLGRFDDCPTNGLIIVGNITGGYTMKASVKFVKFVTDNYAPVKEQPDYDVKTEFITQIESESEGEVWYGPISFDDLTAFVAALPIEEAQEFVAVLKGEHNG